jgi:hypothetical protein
MEIQADGARVGWRRHAVMQQLAAAALLVALALPLLPSAAGAAGCGTCDDDGDGLTNYEEYSVYGTDLANGDTDADGLSDGGEVYLYRTAPYYWDTDGDGASDGAEIAYGTNPLVVDFTSPPAPGSQNLPSYDYDGDGLGAYDEQTYGTDVTLYDTDGDGWSDGDEVSYGSSPLNRYCDPNGCG